MPRPKKDPDLVKGEVLRIPVSADQKRRILTAAVATDGEFARWARTILLKVADEYAATHELEKRPEAPRAKGKRSKEAARAASLS